MYKLFLSLRYLRKRLIALFAVGSVTLCVFMVLVVVSVMGGFLEMVKERSRGLLSDIVVDNTTLQGFPYYQEFIDKLNAEMPDEVVKATPVIYNYGILRVQATKYTKPVRVVGIRLDGYEQVNDFASSLHYDKYYPGTTSLGLQRQPIAGFDERDNPLLPPEFEMAHQRWLESDPDPEEVAKYRADPYSPIAGARVFAQGAGPPSYHGGEDEELYGLIVGCDIINDRTPTGEHIRTYALGSEMLLTLLPVTAEGVLSGEGSITLSVRYADDSRTGVYEIDEMNVYADFGLIQRVLRMDPQERIDGSFTPARASQVLIRLADDRDTQNARRRIQKLWGIDTIHRANLDGTGSEEIIAAGERIAKSGLHYALRSLLYDASRRRLYWATDTNRIFRANADGSGIEEVLDEAQLPAPIDGPPDTVDGKKYWVTPEGNIQRANADGTEVETIASPGSVAPDGFTMDAKGGRIYWVERSFVNSLDVSPISMEASLLRAVSVETWQERQRKFIQAVEKEKVMMIIVLGIMSVVTIALIGCIFYMVVEKKTRDIGIIKSLGASSAGVAWIFLAYAAAVGLAGAVIGTAGGWVFVHYINEIQDWLASFNPELRVWSPEVYTFDRIPNVVDPVEAITIVVVAMAAAMLGALIPAWLAARVWPVDALRYE